MLEDQGYHRRRFLGAAAVSAAASQLAIISSANAQSSRTEPVAEPTTSHGITTGFGPLKQIDAGVLSMGYAELGPIDGPAAILLHGWPYDIHAFVDAAPMLAGAGYRVLVPYLPCYGTTRFLSPDTPRNGQQSVVAVDIIALMDALRIQQAA